MDHKIWFMEGLSSQSNIIQEIKQFSQVKRQKVTVYTSHRNHRNEILSLADYSLIEPKEPQQRLSFIKDVINQLGIQVLHTGRHCVWFESHREEIESLGVKLTTGATSVEKLTIADDKVAFAHFMEAEGLPVVPSVRVDSAAELTALLANPPFSVEPLCVKPVTGIYGMGFWCFDESVSPMAAFTHPEMRRVNSRAYLSALEATEKFEPLVLMPYLQGPEHSVDMLVEKGKVLSAVSRRKEGALQYLENSGEAYELAKSCAQVMQADGLVNVQTRNNEHGKPVLLEINMRPSGGIGYIRHAGVNLPGYFALRQLGLISEEQVIAEEKNHFKSVIVRSITDFIRYDPVLQNSISLDKSE